MWVLNTTAGGTLSDAGGGATMDEPASNQVCGLYNYKTTGYFILIKPTHQK
jgi:hypothetical protein